MSKILCATLFVFVGLFGAASPVLAEQSPPDSAQAKEIVALVERAAALINAKGKAAFAEFKNNASEWRKGDAYLFITDMKGVSMLNMGFPKFEGTDTSALKDSTGKAIVKEQIALTQSQGAGWLNYMWPKPGQTEPLKKWSYVKAVSVDGKPGYVGAGFYPK